MEEKWVPFKAKLVLELQLGSKFKFLFKIHLSIAEKLLAELFQQKRRLDFLNLVADLSAELFQQKRRLDFLHLVADLAAHKTTLRKST